MNSQAPDRDISIRELTADHFVTHVDDLASILHAIVQSGASVGFIQPFSLADSRAFWQQAVLPPVDAGHHQLLVATLDGRTVGTVQMVVHMRPNQVHRAEVSKLLVHPEFQGHGIAKALMEELQRRAGEMGKRLLTLDTRTGDVAESLYRQLGFVRAGVIPAYCRAPDEEVYDSTSYMYKIL